MAGGVVGAEGQPDQQQGPHQGGGPRAEGGRQQAHQQQTHGGDEHGPAAPAIRQATQGESTDQDAQQGGGRHQTTLAGRQGELFSHQGQGDTAHEHDQPLEELAGRGQPPHQPLQRRQGGRALRGAARRRGGGGLNAGMVHGGPGAGARN